MPDQRKLRTTFDSAATSYHRARPEYPEQLYDALVGAAGLDDHDRLLEIGAATGKATVPLARRGCRITCIEPGPSLAAQAHQNLAEFSDVHIVESTFESVDPAEHEPFDLVFAATAWELLRPGGHLAFWSATHVFPEGGDPFFWDLQPVYEEIGEGLPPGATHPLPGELPDQSDEIVASGLFEPVLVKQFAWLVTYDADGYLQLLDTFSGHIAMEPWQRDRLYTEIRRRLAERPDGLLHRAWGAVLHVARRDEGTGDPSG